MLQTKWQSNPTDLSQLQPNSAPEARPEATAVKSANSALIKEGSHAMLASMASLDDTGLTVVTATCCQLEMDVFLRRFIAQMGLDICDEVMFLTMVPMYNTCRTGVTNVANLTKHITATTNDPKCKMAAKAGSCPQQQPGCATSKAGPLQASHRRRQCTPRIEKPKAGEVQKCPLPEGAAWCEVRLKNLKPYFMAVYDWNVKADWVSYNVCEAGFWDEQDPSVFGEPGHLLDIGGNMGYFTFALAQSGWTATTFEPMAPNLALINATMCRNPELAKRVQINPMGLGNKSDECKMFAPEKNEGDGHVQCGEDVASGFTKETIAQYNLKEIGQFSIRRLDDMLPQLGISTVDLVKIDVEGYESQVIAGGHKLLSDYRPRRVKAEVWNNSFGSSGQNFLSTFENAGYKFFKDGKCQTAIDAKSELKGILEVFMCT